MRQPSSSPEFYRAIVRQRHLLVSVLAAIGFASCATASRDRAWLSTQLEQRTGHGLQTRNNAPTVVLADGLDEDEAVAQALFTSPAFLADVATLRLAQADFDEATRVDNPRLSVLGPVGAITAAASLVGPILSLLQLSQRTEAASRKLEAVAESLVQSGLNVARDARLAHIQCGFAERRVAILRAQQKTAEGLARLTKERADVGDVSPGDALLLLSQAALASDAVGNAERDLVIARATLRALLGLGTRANKFTIVTTRDLPPSAPPLVDLLAVARRARPDVRAAELELEATGEVVGIERYRYLAPALQADVQWTGKEVGARFGGSMDLPIFNQNQGNIGRAEASVQAAVHRLEGVRQLVSLEIITARSQLTQALASHTRYQDEVLPALEGVLKAAKQQYDLGDVPYLVVLDADSRLASAQLREAELDAEARRAHAQLERAVGARMEFAMTKGDR